MKGLFEKLASWWSSRNMQERRTLVIAMPIVLFLVIYLVLIQPIWGMYSERKVAYEHSRDTLTWLYESEELVGRLQNSCPNRVSYLQGNEGPQALAQNIARRSSISARVDLKSGSEALVIKINSAPGSRLLTYVQALACNGFKIDKLRISQSGTDQSMVVAEFEAFPAVLPRLPQ